eukprot:9498712-Pyramimonas_sp.AAC.2
MGREISFCMAAFGHSSMKPTVCWTDAPWAKQFERAAKQMISQIKKEEKDQKERLYRVSGAQRQWTSGNKATPASQAYPVKFCEKVLSMHVWWRCRVISEALIVKELCLNGVFGERSATVVAHILGFL